MEQITRVRSLVAGTAALIAAVSAYVVVGPMAGVTWSLHHGSGYYAARFVGLAGFPLVATVLCDVLYQALDRSNLVFGWRRDLGGEILHGLGRKRYSRLQKARPDEIREWGPIYRAQQQPSHRLVPHRIVPLSPKTYDDQRRRNLLLIERELLPGLRGTSGKMICATYWENRRAYDLVGIVRTALVLGSVVGVAYAGIRGAGQDHLDFVGELEGLGIVMMFDLALVLCANSVRRTKWKNMRDIGHSLGRHYRKNPAAFLAVVPVRGETGSVRRIEIVSTTTPNETASREPDAAPSRDESNDVASEALNRDDKPGIDQDSAA